MLKFEPKKYLSSASEAENENQIMETSNVPSSLDDYEKVKEVVSVLETSGTDITGNYGDWIKIGFAFADAFGSMGEELFLRVSSNYPKYDAASCRKQYQKCLQSNNSGVSLGTFFHLAKLAGVTPSQAKPKVVALQASKPK
ncbi:PriCT-2 domain-containing protein, partial [Aquimarina macrocephali]|uniref:PriCT-2 domain-containing protein n=1 Tax=Aquimarina macrocephali TaxID=666563 RepID=UPI00157B727C